VPRYAGTDSRQTVQARRACTISRHLSIALGIGSDGQKTREPVEELLCLDEPAFVVAVLHV